MFYGMTDVTIRVMWPTDPLPQTGSTDVCCELKGKSIDEFLFPYRQRSIILKYGTAFLF